MLDQAPTQMEPTGKEHPNQNFWQKNKVVIIATVVGVLLVGLLAGLLYMAATNPTATATARDVMIIVMAFVSCLIGVAIIVLIAQVAMLTQLLRDEIKPLMESAQETMNVLRGTTAFMSENLVEPTIKASSAAAGVRRIVEVLFDWRPGSKRK